MTTLPKRFGRTTNWRTRKIYLDEDKTRRNRSGQSDSFVRDFEKRSLSWKKQKEKKVALGNTYIERDECVRLVKQGKISTEGSSAREREKKDSYKCITSIAVLSRSRSRSSRCCCHYFALVMPENFSADLLLLLQGEMIYAFELKRRKKTPSKFSTFVCQCVTPNQKKPSMTQDESAWCLTTSTTTSPSIKEENKERTEKEEEKTTERGENISSSSASAPPTLFFVYL